MAEENKNTGPSLSGDSASAKEQVQRSQQIRKDQGDYLNLVKDTESALKRVISAYESIEGKLNALNKGSINLREINKALYKETERREILLSKERNLGKQIQENRKDDLKNLAKRKDLDEAVLDTIMQQLNVQEQAYFNLQKAISLNEEGVIFAKQKLEVEKRINDSVGISGRLMGMLGKKLGANNDIYEDMVENARDLERVGAKLTFFDKFKFLTKSVASSTWQSIKDPFIAIPAIGGAIAGVVGLLKSAFDYILGIQDQTVKFARALNLSTVDARNIKMEYASFSVSSGDVLINTQKLVEAQMELTGILGITNALNAQNLATVSKLKDIAGLEADTRTGIVTTSLITGKSVEQTTKSVLSQVIGLTKATGIGFQYQKILREAASQSGVLGLQFAKYPEKLTKSLLTTKALGLELKQLDSIANSFLDFESSISKEFEAQLLTGKEINLAKAREAFLNNDLATAAAEITRQVGTSGEFLEMNRFKQESIADSMGMSRDALADMLKQQEMMAAFGAKNTKELYAQVEAYRQQGREREAIAKLGSEDAYQSLINASAQERIAGFVDKIKQSLADFVERTGIIDKIENMVKFLSKPENIRAVVIQVRDVFASLVEIVATLASGIITTLDFFGAISDQKAASAQAFLSGAADKVRSLGGDFGATSISDTVATNANTGMFYQGSQASTTSKTPMVVEAHLKGPIQVVDMATNIQGRINRGVFPEYTNMY